MRKKIVAGNWKMNLTFPEGIKLINDIIQGSESLSDVQLVIAPPFTYSHEASKILEKTNIGLAAQNCTNNEEGAFTGEISAKMLNSIGVKYVILGHSERRAYYGETDEIVNEKIKLALKYSINPIVCCGEVLPERENNEHFSVVAKQIKGMFYEITPKQVSNIIIAYEPVWAIGTGKTATPKQAQEMHHFIREAIQNSYGHEIANNLSILYGGSCKPSTAKDIFHKSDVDGGLIGGASLNADDFINIANSF